MGDAREQGFLDVPDGEFWLFSGPYRDENKEQDLPLSRILDAYVEDNSRYWFKKKVSPVRDLSGVFSGMRPSPRLSSSKTGFDLVVRDPEVLELDSSGVGWGTTIARHPRTSSPLKVNLPNLYASPVGDDLPETDECIHDKFLRVTQSETVSWQRTEVVVDNRLCDDLNRVNLNETFHAVREPESPKFNGTFVADSPGGISVNGTFVASPNVANYMASNSPRSAHNQTFRLDDEPTEVDERAREANQTFPVPPVNFNGGNFVNETFDSPVDSNIDSQGSRSQESLCSGASGVSADSDSLNVKQPNTLGRSMPDLATRSRVAQAKSRGLAPNPNMCLPMTERLQGRLQPPKPSKLPSAKARNAPLYRSETKLNETLRVARPAAVINGTRSGRPQTSSTSNLAAPSSRTSRLQSQGIVGNSRSTNSNPTRSSPSPSRASLPTSRNPQPNAVATNKFGTFRKPVSAFAQQPMVNMTLEGLQQTSSRPSLAARRPADDVSAGVQPQIPQASKASGLARPSKLPAPGSRIAKPPVPSYSGADNRTFSGVNNVDYEGQLATLLPRKHNPRPALRVPQWDDDCY